jgi:quercetin dioxygenase-like cupin family protein
MALGLGAPSTRLASVVFGEGLSMKLLMVAVCASALMAMSATAQSLPAPTNILFSNDVPVVPMAEWEIEQRGAAEQTGARILIAAGPEEIARAPATAIKYDSQTFRFPTGSLRVLTFNKKAGGVLHQITTETQIYVLKGSGVVDVRGVPTEIRAGDVVNLPSGVLRSRKGKPEDTKILAFTVGHTMKDAKATVVRGKDTPDKPLTEGPKSGVDTAKVSVQRYVFDGNSVRVARLKAPGKTSVAKPATDVLIYVASGQMQITVGNEVKEVSAGDVLREEAGLPTFWDVRKDSMFIATNAPLIKQ